MREPQASNPEPTGDSASGVAVLIPTHDPDERLLELVDDLRARGLDTIIVVDDGSQTTHRPVLKNLAEVCTVLTHASPLGKGRALKTGLNHGYLAHPELVGLLTVDPDGQHSADDVAEVARTLQERPERLVMGQRQFDHRLPLLSRAGNAITRLVILLLTGLRLTDAQCGLRAIPRDLVPYLLQVKGEGLDYELQALIAAARRGVPVKEVPIRTVGPEPRAPGFNPALDSLAIYFLLVRFAFSSLFCAGVDTAVYYLLIRGGWSLAMAVFAARLASSLLNFLLNRGFVFRSDRSVLVTASLYYGLVVIVGALSYGSIRLLHDGLGVGFLWAKILSESVLFSLSFLAQRDLIFRRAEWSSRRKT